MGIVGGGQLGRMLTIAAHKLGFRVIILDPTPNSSAGQVADKQIVGSFKDEEKIKELAKEVEFLTFEIELANAKILEELTTQGLKINPSAKTLTIIKDKLLQKEFLKKSHIATAEFIPVETKEDIADAAKMFGYPVLLKARFDAYDGRGNALIKSSTDIVKGMKKLQGRLLYVEKFVPFTKELSVVIARSTKGDIAPYPVVETIHKNNICHTVIAPAPVDTEMKNQAYDLAISVMEHLGGAGVFGIEMFLRKDGKVLVNEIAPRVHNSGHHTIEANETSQFEQHIRAITDMPLGRTDMIVPAAVMVNILGEREGKAKPQGVENATNLTGVFVHLYGKMETRRERKMGHITAIGNTVEEAWEKAEKARKYITI
ncbi:MAG: 5-(carboxyamino)imidazole ribonucleotide synthase [Candidatus Levyibacteriota bacterium]